MKNQEDDEKHSKETVKRSLVKAIFYRLIIISLDFVTVYIFTGKVTVALGFMLVSNIYTTAVYFLYERAWGKIKWGRKAIVS